MTDLKQKLRVLRISIRDKHEKLVTIRTRDVEILKQEIKELDEFFKDLDDVLKLWEKKI